MTKRMIKEGNWGIFGEIWYHGNQLGLYSLGQIHFFHQKKVIPSLLVSSLIRKG